MFYHADGLGSIVAMTDDQGNIVQRYSYEAFGQLTATNPSFDNIYTYTGREYDKETGLYYYRARYYDAMEGRFISKDPISFLGGSANLYSYVGNNSVNFIDPWGLWSIFVGFTFGAHNSDIDFLRKGSLEVGMGAVIRDNDGNWFSSKTYQTIATNVDCPPDTDFGASLGFAPEIGFFTGDISGDAKTTDFDILYWTFTHISDGENWGLSANFSGLGLGAGRHAQDANTTVYDSAFDMPGVKNASDYFGL